jgi:cGMP-dependent protein kinase
MGCPVGKPRKSQILDTKSTSNLTLPLKLRNVKSVNRSLERKSILTKTILRNYSLFLNGNITELSSGSLDPREKSPEDLLKIKKIIKKHFLFTSIPKSELKVLVKDFLIYKYPDDSYVFCQGSNGNYFYIITTGAVEVIINDQTKSFLNKESCFGDIALLHDSPRSATIKTIEPTELWVLSRPSFRRAIKSVSKTRFSNNKSFLDSIPFFKALNIKQKNQILGLAVSQDFKCGDRIVTEGDPGDIFYVILKGIVSCSIDGLEVRRLGVGEFFGEQALLYTNQRTATVTALSDISVLSIGGEDLIQVFQSKLQDVIYKNSQRIAMERNSLFKYLTKEQIEACIESMEILSYESNDLVFKKGEQMDEVIFFVMRGSVSSESTSKSLFDCFGDVQLRTGFSYYSEDFIADEDSDLACLSLASLEDAIGGKISSIIALNEMISIIKQVHILRPLSSENLKKVVSLLKELNYNEKDLIFKQGDTGDSFFIVKEGRVDIIKEGIFLRSVGKNDYFGERAILSSETRSANAVARTASVLWALSKADFFRIIEPVMQKHLLKRIQLQNDSIQLEDLVFIKVIGEGTFGKVLLVKDIKEEVFYALKVINRWKVSEYNMFENLKHERDILLQLDHPMLMKLVKTFKDEDWIYFLCEYVAGHDLFDVLRILHKIDDDVSRFYIGASLLVLKYLHEKSIIYRDLKPENIMIDEDGYLKLIDFGAAKIIKERTFTILGTPHYMAPEIILGNGYGLEADLWSLGIMLYEFFFYVVPFADDERDSFKIYKRILEEPLKFPKKKVACKDLVKKLLSKNPVNRGNCEDVMKHEWFNDFNWEDLINKGMDAPFIPELDSQDFCKDEVLVKNTLSLNVHRPEKQEDLCVPKGWDKDF